MFNLLGIGADVVFVLYSHTRVDLGGMGRSVIILFYRIDNSCVLTYLFLTFEFQLTLLGSA